MEEPSKTFDVDPADSARAPIDLQRDFLAESDEFPTHERLVLEIADVFESLSLLILRAFKDALERPVFLEKLARDFGAYERNAGHVVGRIADKRLKIDDLFRRDAPVRHEIGRVVPAFFADQID